MNFRKDINGLRAIAVIAVVLFHFHAAWMPGGFAGVDVFFVISGFLMTGIIFRGIEKETFSILNFYVARANRIIPALAALCFVLLVFGWFYLTPLDYKSLGEHVLSSLAFVSNIIYLRDSGYFDAASYEKWLLHTWSLSAEWQFYILYPLVLVAMRKFMSVGAMKATVLLGTVLGFLFCVVATMKRPDAAYYLLPTRAWEMMLGGVAYLYPLNLNDKKKKLFEWVGLALILVSYLFVSKENPWPGYLALIPVMGAFLIIQAQRNDSIVTGNAVFQKLGKWSYSIYLWHWPFVVAIAYFSLSQNYIYPGIAVSIFLGFLSNKYIERIKFRNNFDPLIEYLKCKPVYMAFLVGLLGAYVLGTNGVEGHYSNDVVVASKEGSNRNPHRCLIDNKFPCYIGNKENISAIMIGDSHADALTTSLAHAFDLDESGIIGLTRQVCPFVLNIKLTQHGEICLNENIRRMEFLKDNYPNVPVFWVARTGAYLYGQSNPNRIRDSRDTRPLMYFTETYDSAEDALFKELASNLDKTLKQVMLNRPVYLVLPTPEMRRNIPKGLSKDLLFYKTGDDFSIDEKLYFERNARVRKLIVDVAAKNQVGVLDPVPYLCQNGRCMAQYENRPLYYDGDHLSEYGNKLLTPMFKSALQ